MEAGGAATRPDLEGLDADQVTAEEEATVRRFLELLAAAKGRR